MTTDKTKDEFIDWTGWILIETSNVVGQAIIEQAQENCSNHTNLKAQGLRYDFTRTFEDAQREANYAQ